MTNHLQSQVIASLELYLRTQLEGVSLGIKRPLVYPVAYSVTQKWRPKVFLGTLEAIVAVYLETLVSKVAVYSVCKKIKIVLKAVFLVTIIVHVVEDYSVKKLNQLVYLGLKMIANHPLPVFLERNHQIPYSQAIKMKLNPKHNQKAYLEILRLQYQGLASLVVNMITSTETPRLHNFNKNQRKTLS